MIAIPHRAAGGHLGSGAAVVLGTVLYAPPLAAPLCEIEEKDKPRNNGRRNRLSLPSRLISRWCVAPTAQPGWQVQW